MSSEPIEDPNDVLPLPLAEQLDDICDRYEAAWCAGERPRIEDSVKGIEEPLRARLLQELVALEVAYRREQGESPHPAEYEARLRLVASCLSDWEAPQRKPSYIRQWNVETGQELTPFAEAGTDFVALECRRKVYSFRQFKDRLSLANYPATSSKDHARPLGPNL